MPGYNLPDSTLLQIQPEILFERYVNSKDNQTDFRTVGGAVPFERYVNSKDNQTLEALAAANGWFERYVNSKDNQTSTV